MNKLIQSQFKVNKQLTLKVLQLENAEELFSLIDNNREYLKQWLTWLDCTTHVLASYEFIRSCMCEYMQGTGFFFGIFYSDDAGSERLVGMVSLAKALGSLNLGYWLAKDMQGRGIISICAKFLTRLALTEINTNRVIIRCALGNTKSQAVPERLGYTKEGIARELENLHGTWSDLVVYSFVKSDLNKLDKLD